MPSIPAKQDIYDFLNQHMPAELLKSVSIY